MLGLVGESGSGKSLLCRSLVRLLPSTRLRISGGSVMLAGRDLTTASDAEMLEVRGGEIGMIFQNPTSHLDPVMRIGDQIAEGIRFHQGLDARRAARGGGGRVLAQVGFPDPARQYDSYPHEFSGGMRQRAMIAAALSCNPKILIADEPTTALDVTIQAQILRLLMDIRARRGLSIILITHDLGIVAQICDRIAVMRQGRVVEVGEKRGLLAAPSHAYTRSLIASHPSLPDGGRDAAVRRSASRRARCRWSTSRSCMCASPAADCSTAKLLSTPSTASACASCRARRSASSANPAAARARSRAPSSA